MYLQIPDAMTYLQASGRTSRMFAGGLSKGLSIVLVDDEKLFSGLVRQTRWYSEDVEWRSLEEVDLGEILEEIDRDRERIRLIMEGKLQAEVGDLLKTALVVVESPSKARTIASFFGRPSKRRMRGLLVYEVGYGGYVLSITASKGHVFDLVTKEGYYGVKTLDGAFVPVYTTIKKCRKCGAQFTDQEVCPACKSADYADQADVVEALRELAEEVDFVILATDPDTEGEKIAWDLEVALAPYVRDTRRIEFHEVTRRAFLEALANPREVDERLVNAQLVRRIEDRWIGFVLSQKLWSAFGKKWLSAGRVQSPVLGWVIDRYNEAKKSLRHVYSVLLENGVRLFFDNIQLEGVRPSKIAQQIREEGVEIESAVVEEEVLNPPPPFSTDTMLREASAVLRIGVDEVMRLAQDLFELGLITYHRTDSTRVSRVGRTIAGEYIKEVFGEEYFVPREWSREGAHECIRPTRPIDASKLRELLSQGVLTLAKPLTRYHFGLYDLVFRRFIASQMPRAVVLRQKVVASTLGFSKEFTSYVGVVEAGFTAIYRPFKLGPKLEPGRYAVEEVSYKRVATIPLYSQADVVQLMKEREIGRPSTYAKILKTLEERHYVIVTKRKKLVPTKLGVAVYEYLRDRYSEFISEERTRLVEKIMDQIEEGLVDYQEALRELYDEIRRVDSA